MEMLEKKFELNSTIATIYVADMWPSKGIFPKPIEQQFNFRKYGILEGENIVGIADMHEPIWWNRPQLEDASTVWGVMPDGNHCCNLPIFLGKNKKWKSDYNVLLNKHNVPTVIQLKFEHDLTSEEILKLRQMSFSVVIKTLTRLDIPEKELCVINNDLLLRGKKFMGSEQIIKESIFTECIFITLKYKEEQEIFNRLSSGKVSATAHREITGLLDEYETFTKEEFLKVYCEEFKKYLDQFEL